LATQLLDAPEIFSTKPQASISMTIKLNDGLEVDIRIPVGYPDTEKLSASCRLKKSTLSVPGEEVILNNEVTTMLNSSSIDLLSLINFCEEKLDILKETRSSNKDTTEGESFDNTPAPAKICRMWIHSHHIYNKNKRKFLIDTAGDRNLSGFSLPGKPGFVCIEGSSEDCEDYWFKVRQLNWQKISLIQKEVDVVPAFLQPFEELHCDKSDFIKYLEAKSLDGIIKQYLGF